MMQVIDTHSKFKFQKSSSELIEADPNNKQAKAALFKLYDTNSIYRCTPWMRCLEYFNDISSWALKPCPMPKDAHIYGLMRSKLSFSVLSGRKSGFVVGFGSHIESDLTDFDYELVRLLWATITRSPIPLVFYDVKEVIPKIDGRQQLGPLYVSFVKLPAMCWKRFSSMSLFLKLLRYYEWRLAPHRVANFKEAPTDSNFRELMRSGSSNTADYPIRARLSGLGIKQSQLMFRRDVLIKDFCKSTMSQRVVHTQGAARLLTPRDY